MPPAWKQKLYADQITEGDTEEIAAWKRKLRGEMRPPTAGRASAAPSPRGDAGGSVDDGQQQQQRVQLQRPPKRKGSTGKDGGPAGAALDQGGAAAATAAKASGQGGQQQEQGGGETTAGQKGKSKGSKASALLPGRKAGKAVAAAAAAGAEPEGKGPATAAAAAAGLRPGRALGAKGQSQEPGKRTSEGAPHVGPVAAAARPAAADASRLFQNKGKSVLLFQDASFNPEAFINTYFSGLSEKGIEGAAQELMSLNEYCNQEIRTSVHKHHKAFLQASLAIPEMDQAVAELRACVQGAEAVAQTLSKARALALGPTLRQPVGAPPVPSSAASTATSGAMYEASEEQVAVAELLAELEVAVAEHDVPAASTILRAGRMMLQVIDRDQAALQASGLDVAAFRERLESGLEAKRLVMVNQLESQLSVPSSSTAEIRTAASYLAVLSGDCRAASCTLACHSLKLQETGQALLKFYSSAAGEEDGLQYAGCLAQRTFLQVSRAADDLEALFGGSSKEVYALLLQWSAHEAHVCSRAVVQNALAPLSSSSDDLRDAAQCVAMVLTSCLVLEQDHRLSLVDHMQPELWGHMESVLRKQLSRMVAELYSQAAEDAAKALAQQAYQDQMSAVMHAVDPQLPSPTAEPRTLLAASWQLLLNVQNLAQALLPLASLAGPALAALMGPWLIEIAAALAAGCSSGLERAVADSIATAGLAAQRLGQLADDLRAAAAELLVEVEGALSPLAVAAVGAGSFLAAAEKLQLLLAQVGVRAVVKHQQLQQQQQQQERDARVGDRGRERPELEAGGRGAEGEDTAAEGPAAAAAGLENRWPGQGSRAQRPGRSRPAVTDGLVEEGVEQASDQRARSRGRYRGRGGKGEEQALEEQEEEGEGAGGHGQQGKGADAVRPRQQQEGEQGGTAGASASAPRRSRSRRRAAVDLDSDLDEEKAAGGGEEVSGADQDLGNMGRGLGEGGKGGPGRRRREGGVPGATVRDADGAAVEVGSTGRARTPGRAARTEMLRWAGAGAGVRSGDGEEATTGVGGASAGVSGPAAAAAEGGSEARARTPGRAARTGAAQQGLGLRQGGAGAAGQSEVGEEAAVRAGGPGAGVSGAAATTATAAATAPPAVSRQESVVARAMALAAARRRGAVDRETQGPAVAAKSAPGSSSDEEAVPAWQARRMAMRAGQREQRAVPGDGAVAHPQAVAGSGITALGRGTAAAAAAAAPFAMMHEGAEGHAAAVGRRGLAVAGQPSEQAAGAGAAPMADLELSLPPAAVASSRRALDSKAEPSRAANQASSSGGDSKASAQLRVAAALARAASARARREQVAAKGQEAEQDGAGGGQGAGSSGDDGSGGTATAEGAWGVTRPAAGSVGGGGRPKLPSRLEPPAPPRAAMAATVMQRPPAPKGAPSSVPASGEASRTASPPVRDKPPPPTTSATRSAPPQAPSPATAAASSSGGAFPPPQLVPAVTSGTVAAVATATSVLSRPPRRAALRPQLSDSDDDTATAPAAAASSAVGAAAAAAPTRPSARAAAAGARAGVAAAAAPAPAAAIAAPFADLVAEGGGAAARAVRPRARASRSAAISLDDSD